MFEGLGCKVMAQFVTNADAVLRSSKATQKQVQAAMLTANAKTAQAGQEFVRRFIPPQKGNGRFPGYAATGTLRDAVSWRGPTPIPGGVKSEIYMAQNASAVYQRIHEQGGVIRARNAPFLVFKVNGRWVRTKQVTIRPKRYWRDGWQYGLSRFQAVFEKYMRMGLK